MYVHMRILSLCDALRSGNEDACSSALCGGCGGAPVPAQCRLLDGEVAVDIEPLAGRLVLMLSGAVDHAVLPSLEERVALTAWCQ